MNRFLYISMWLAAFLIHFSTSSTLILGQNGSNLLNITTSGQLNAMGDVTAQAGSISLTELYHQVQNLTKELYALQNKVDLLSTELLARLSGKQLLVESTSNWAVPENVTMVRFELYGGGGAGALGAASGGGGGAYCSKLVSVVAGNIFNFTIGPGGTGGGNGGATEVLGLGLALTAAGGQSTRAGGAAPVNCDINLSGSPGSADQNSATGFGRGGDGAGPLGGAGGNGAAWQDGSGTVSVAGTAGVAYGGGGGWSGYAATSRPGAQGAVLISW